MAEMTADYRASLILRGLLGIGALKHEVSGAGDIIASQIRAAESTERLRCAKVPREVWGSARKLTAWCRNPGELVDDITVEIMKGTARA